MARPTHFLLATALIYLCTCLPPAASSPAFLKPEGSYSPREEENIKRLDELLTQFLNQLAISLGKNPTPLSEESTGEVLVPLPPRPAYIPPVKPGQADGPSEGGSQEGHATQPANGPGTSGRIVFPSD